MKILHLTPGTGAFHCGSCLRDQDLAKGVRAAGHDFTVIPLYLPLVVDHESAETEGAPIFLGGVNLYLQQKLPLFRHTPRWLDRLLDGRSFLRKAGRRVGMTSARDLGEMTVGSLRGMEGPQRKEIGRLIDWMASQKGFEVISISNALLLGLVPELQARLPGARLVCSLQGEDTFLDSLTDPWRADSWNRLRALARGVDLFTAVSHYHGQLMQKRLDLSDSQLRVVSNGVDVEAFAPAPPDPPKVPVIGYLARLFPDKGLLTFVEAFLKFRQTELGREAQALIAGACLPADEPWVEDCRQRLRAQGCEAAVTWLPNCSFEEKVAFFHQLSVFSVPAVYGESFGLYVVEAMASGVPVVQPRHGGFVEIVERAGGGLLVEPPGDPSALAEAWEEVLGDEEGRARLAREARESAVAHFSRTRMVANFLAAVA
ncbi:MAG: glycosyltransferase family 4 protein [Verrucomicrobiota bacterium]